MRIYPLGLVVAGVLAFGCDKGGMSAAACKREAAALRDLLVAAAAEPPTFDVGDVTLVMRTDLPRDLLQYSPVVRVEKNGIRLDDIAIHDMEQLRAELDKAAATIEERIARGAIRLRDMREPQRSHLVIDAGTPVAKIVTVFEAMTKSKLPAVAFVFGTPQSVKPPPRSSIDPEIDQLMASADVSDRATRMAELMNKEVARCPAAQKVFGSVGADESNDKALIVAEGINESLPECGCNVDIPRVRSLLFRIIYVEKPVRLLPLDPKAPPEEIAVNPTATWADLSKQLRPDTKNVRFVVR
jgi:hypothetical protein